MIVKNPNFKYKVNFVDKGVDKKGGSWTRFSIGDYNKFKKETVYFTVMCFDELDIHDGDEIIFKDYLVGGHKYNGKDYTTIHIKKDDIEIVEMANDGFTLSDIDQGDLPF